MLTFDNRAFRDIASQAPYDVVEILANGQTYGGGGIFNLYATVAADSAWAPYVFVHEFGHHFAGLADEYYTSDVAYLPAAERVEPWEMNVTALHDPASLKWKDLVTPGTPLPTPWNKEAFEAHSREIQAKRRAIRAANRPEAEMDALFRVQQTEETATARGRPHAHAVGAFEGAMYEARGYYRPQVDCVMFTRERGAVLRGVPEGDGEGDRPLQSVNHDDTKPRRHEAKSRLGRSRYCCRLRGLRGIVVPVVVVTQGAMTVPRQYLADEVRTRGLHHPRPARDGVSSWEGVRNYQARNFMRDQMQVGDGVLFYASAPTRRA